MITYLDSNVLIAAFLGEPELSQKAMEVIDDPERVLASSEFVRLELLPKPIFYQKRDSVEF
jgi:hypothetical protein